MGAVRYIPFILLFINALLFTAGNTSVQEGGDVDLHPFIKVGSKYYLVAQDLKLDWFGAAHFCRSYDSDLLTIESLAEKNALFVHLSPLFKIGQMRVWTSSNDLSVEGTFMSLNSGRPMLYAFWGQNEPNNAGNGEDCVEVVLRNDLYMMNDNNCSTQMQIICEKRSPLNARNSATKSNCENVTENCGLKKLVEVFLQSANVLNCRA
ncbi:C-type lectin 37Db-like [Bactrocera neohumeralis]|uniref:C-type lectin 37Db-like n=1 Tax=Bactrocera neohumeralis TaxID=98809 RepID=UPI0021650E9F|nr:C-type lectin 37Db-like [Bactrocera neohumeralis]